MDTLQSGDYPSAILQLKELITEGVNSENSAIVHFYMEKLYILMEIMMRLSNT